MRFVSSGWSASKINGFSTAAKNFKESIGISAKPPLVKSTPKESKSAEAKMTERLQGGVRALHSREFR